MLAVDVLNTADAQADLAEGHRLSQARRYAEAAACARAAIAVDPDLAMAHNNLGFALQMQGEVEGAVAAYRRALALAPRHRLARRNLAMLLARLGRREEALVQLHAELRTREGLPWLQARISAATRAHDLRFAAELQSISAEIRLATPFWPKTRNPDLSPFPVGSPGRWLTAPKLRHDLDQIDYLRRTGVFGEEIEPVVAAYQRVLERIAPRGDAARSKLSAEDLADIGDVFNRIVYLRPTPRVERALSDRWDPVKVEQRYLGCAPGVVVIDDFFTPEALAGIRAFCLESTIWSANRYGHGRLGAFFHEGFNCPLLIQFAEELRDALPRMIGRRHTVRQIWGFKQSPYQPGDTTTHADFAAVNVNVWITPEAANLDPSTGGLKIYNVDAPPHWDFSTYNGRSDVIKPFLARQEARTLVVPYRQNRAVIFNSDLFHGTETIRFRPEYENRRINITALYGVREEDHRRLAKPDVLTGPTEPAWRSAAFARNRLGH